MKERLEQEIAEYNSLIDQITQVRERLAQLETERERRMGRIELLNEMATQDAGDEPDKSESKGESKSKK